MRHIALLSLILAACAVAPPPQTSDAVAGGVSLDATISSPNKLLLTLRNDSAAQLGYNLCASAFERLEGGSWQPVPSNVICTMELRTLAPGQTATFVKEIPSGLAAGQYRIVTNVEAPLGETQAGVRSAVFEIR